MCDFLSSPHVPSPPPPPSYEETVTSQKTIVNAKDASLERLTEQQKKLGAKQLQAKPASGLRYL